ncbi:hypothetical protein TNCT_574751 [Trichonephila clavata]|uniref:Uncharacterized protein n=1 Tax=Trichonephila clavata TaxID=2740835 RepID=A0A8X6EZG6_TRICU|nr:hypothetical protein TNCT_574751 [Trichonephila clavata]
MRRKRENETLQEKELRREIKQTENGFRNFARSRTRRKSNRIGMARLRASETLQDQETRRKSNRIGMARLRASETLQDQKPEENPIELEWHV